MINVDRRRWESVNKDTAKCVGLLAHETAHAEISAGMETAENMARAAGKKQAMGVMTLLEEIRVEAYAIRRSPAMRPALRMSFSMILDGIAKNPPSNEAEAARAWALVAGRTLGGIATPGETGSFDTAARTVLGDDRIDQMVELLQEAIQLNLPGESERMIEIAEEWVDLVGTSGDEGDDSCNADKNGASEKMEAAKRAKAPVSSDSTDDDDGEGEEGEGASSGDPEGDGEPSENDSTQSDYGKEGVTSAPLSSDDAEDLLDTVTNDLRDIMEDEWASVDRNPNLANRNEWAAKVFGGKSDYGVKEIDPTPTQRQHVVKAAQFLSNVTVPTISKASRALAMPPGRLRTREGVRRSAERAQGMMVTAKPWKGTKRTHSVAKPLVIGIATDTSGSMKWAESGVAEFAYVYANAGHRIGARTAAVTFGDDVHMISRPGEIMTHVRRKKANGGTEECDHAIAALDGVLHLTDPGTAARILIVVSDGALVKDSETGKVTEWLHRLDKAGTHVVWINNRTPHERYWLNQVIAKLPNATFIEARHGYTDGDVFAALDKAVRKAITDNVTTLQPESTPLYSHPRPRERRPDHVDIHRPKDSCPPYRTATTRTRSEYGHAPNGTSPSSPQRSKRSWTPSLTA